MNTEPILHAAESESARTPAAGALPPATWEFSSKLRDALAAFNTAYDAWQEAHDELDDKIEEFHAAAASDEIARRRAAVASKKDPGVADTERAARALEFATFRTHGAREAAGHAWPATILRQEVNARWPELSADLAARITTATEQYQTALADAQALVYRAQNRLTMLGDELRWADRHLDGFSFGTITGFDDINWPSAYRPSGLWLKKLDYATADTARSRTVDNSFEAVYPDGTAPGDDD